MSTKKIKKNIVTAVAHVYSSFNNTIITITDTSGNCISWATSGGMGFKGSRKSTPYAAQMASEAAAKKAVEHGVKTVEVWVKGPGSGKESSIQAIRSAGIIITLIRDITPVPHNGVRAPKKRRV